MISSIKSFFTDIIADKNGEMLIFVCSVVFGVLSVFISSADYTLTITVIFKKAKGFLHREAKLMKDGTFIIKHDLYAFKKTPPKKAIKTQKMIQPVASFSALHFKAR